MIIPADTAGCQATCQPKAAWRSLSMATSLCRAAAIASMALVCVFLVRATRNGIIPTLEPVNLAAMSDKELAVYELIRAHYLAQFLPHHEFDRTVARLA